MLIFIVIRWWVVDAGLSDPLMRALLVRLVARGPGLEEVNDAAQNLAGAQDCVADVEAVRLLENVPDQRASCQSSYAGAHGSHRVGFRHLRTIRIDESNFVEYMPSVRE